MKINKKELAKLSITDLRNLNEFIVLNMFTTKTTTGDDNKKACCDAIKAEMNERVKLCFPEAVLQ